MNSKHNFPIDILVTYLEHLANPVFTLQDLYNHFKNDNRKAIENRLSLLKRRGWVVPEGDNVRGRGMAFKYRWNGKTELIRKTRSDRAETKAKTDLIQDTVDTAAEMLDVNHECACRKPDTFSALDLGNAVIETIDALKAQNGKLLDELKEVKYSISGREAQLLKEIRHYKQLVTEKEESVKASREKIKALEEALAGANLKLRQAVDTKFKTERSVRLQNGKVLTLDNAFK